MKVKNEYVQVKFGTKEFTKRNMILDKYLNNLFNSQMNTTHTNSSITHCYIKFDNPLENLSYQSELRGFYDFDVAISLQNSDMIIEATKNSLKFTYNFSLKNGFIYERLPYMYFEFEQFVGRKITAIGFGQSGNVYAVVDTSLMNIKVDTSEDFKITRVDTIQSDGIVNGYDYPLHLMNDYDKIDNKKAVLYSVGYGNVEGLIEEENVLSDIPSRDIDTGSNYIKIVMDRLKKVGNYPSENLKLGFYPTMDNTKYIIFKYRLYTVENDTATMLDEYYTTNIKNENDFGNLRIKLSIERM